MCIYCMWCVGVHACYTRVTVRCPGTTAIRSIGEHDAANLRTKILAFRGFDASRILSWRVGIPKPIGNFPEDLSQAILVGIILVGRLGLSENTSKTTIGSKISSCQTPVGLSTCSRFGRALRRRPRVGSPQPQHYQEAAGSKGNPGVYIYIYICYIYIYNIYIYI